MLTLILVIIWRTVATIHGYVLAYAPTNIAIAHLRTPRGLKWAIPSALVAVPAFLYVAWLMTVLVDHGATKWLLLVTLTAYVDACKFAALAVFAPLLWATRAMVGTRTAAITGVGPDRPMPVDKVIP
ncbi:hypothetical protein ACIA03_08370 [Nocardioides sp. NPDC051685]|uniref:hypothetical protein n=1 Tax=Nocardioides sp. NPDC051685 TaxID=3364334 RepID=UPI003799E958